MTARFLYMLTGAVCAVVLGAVLLLMVPAPLSLVLRWTTYCAALSGAVVLGLCLVVP